MPPFPSSSKPFSAQVQVEVEVLVAGTAPTSQFYPSLKLNDCRNNLYREWVNAAIGKLTSLNWVSFKQNIAESYLSLNAVEDAAEFFNQEFRREQPAIERFAYGLCASEMLLINSKKVESIHMVVGELLPLADKLIVADQSDEWNTDNLEQMREFAPSACITYVRGLLGDQISSPALWQRLTAKQQAEIPAKLMSPAK